MACLRPPAARIDDEAGFGIIEVLVSALVVVVISLAILGSMDSASRASGNGKAKAVAADLAQQDQERMQGLKPVDLLGLDKTIPKDVEAADGSTTTYQVRSEGAYVLNPASGSGCTNGQKDEFLRVVSTVTWPGMRTRPVRIESMIAPPLDAVGPGQGSAVLRIVRADGTTPVVGQSVDLLGSQSGRQATGGEGCAFFANFPVGSFSFAFGTPGWVNPNGEQDVTLPIGVTDQDVASLDAVYDIGGRVDKAKFITYYDGAQRVARGDEMALSNSGVQVGGGVRTAPATTPAGNQSESSLSGLFPFTSPYAVYSSGQCGRALPPTMNAAVAGYGGTYQLQVAAGNTYSNVKVFEPALNPLVRVRRPKGTRYTPAGMKVYVRSTDTGCPTDDVQTTAGTTGRLPERGFPYGEYKLCAEYTNGATTYRSGFVTRTNADPAGTSWDLDILETDPQPCV